MKKFLFALLAAVAVFTVEAEKIYIPNSVSGTVKKSVYDSISDTYVEMLFDEIEVSGDFSMQKDVSWWYTPDTSQVESSIPVTIIDKSGNEKIITVKKDDDYDTILEKIKNALSTPTAQAAYASATVALAKALYNEFSIKILEESVQTLATSLQAKLMNDQHLVVASYNTKEGSILVASDSVDISTVTNANNYIKAIKDSRTFFNASNDETGSVTKKKEDLLAIGSVSLSIGGSNYKVDDTTIATNGNTLVIKSFHNEDIHYTIDSEEKTYGKDKLDVMFRARGVSTNKLDYVTWDSINDRYDKSCDMESITTNDSSTLKTQQGKIQLYGYQNALTDAKISDPKLPYTDGSTGLQWKLLSDMFNSGVFTVNSSGKVQIKTSDGDAAITQVSGSGDAQTLSARKIGGTITSSGNMDVKIDSDITSSTLGDYLGGDGSPSFKVLTAATTGSGESASTVLKTISVGVVDLSSITNRLDALEDYTNYVDVVINDTTNRVFMLECYTNYIGVVDNATNRVSQLESYTNYVDAVIDVTNVVIGVTNIVSDITNKIEILEGFTNYVPVVDNVTNEMYRVGGITNLLGDTSWVTNYVGFKTYTNTHEIIYMVTNLVEYKDTTTNMWSTYDAVEKSNAMATNFLFGAGGASNLIQNVHALTNDLRVAMLGYDDSSITAVTNEYAAEGAPSRLLQIKGWLTQQSGCIGELGNVLSAATNTTMYTDKTNVSLLVRHVIHPESGSTETNDTVVLHYMPIGDLATNNPDNKSITLNSLDGTNSALAVSGWGSTSYDEDIDLFRYMADKTYTNFNGHLLYRPMDSTNNPMGYLKIKGGTLTNIFEYASNSIAVVKFLDNVSISSNSDTRVQIYGFEEANDGDVPMVCTSEDTNTVKHIIWTNLTEKITSDVATNIADNASISTNSDYKIQIYDFENADEGDIPMVVKIGDENKICWTNYTTNVVYVDGRSIENPDDLDGDGKRRLQLIDFKEPPEQTMNFSDLIESDGDESEDGEYKVLVRHTTKNQSGSNTCELLYLDTTNSVLGGKWAKSKTGRNGLSGISSYFGEDDAQLGSNITAIAMVADKLLDLYSITTNNNGLLQLQGFKDAGGYDFPYKYWAITSSGTEEKLDWTPRYISDQSIHGMGTVTTTHTLPYTITENKVNLAVDNGCSGDIKVLSLAGAEYADNYSIASLVASNGTAKSLTWVKPSNSVTNDGTQIALAGFSSATEGQVPYKNGDKLAWTNVTAVVSGGEIKFFGNDNPQSSAFGTNVVFDTDSNIKIHVSNDDLGRVKVKMEVYWK